MASKAHVTYIDGTSAIYTIRPAALLKAENYLARRGRTIGEARLTGVLFAAYSVARTEGDAPESFEQWVERLDDFEESGDETEDVAPVDEDIEPF